MPSIERISGVTGLEYSLQSLPSQRIPSSSIPIWQCASMKPGVTRQPVASMTLASAGASTVLPMAAILPSSPISSSPFSISAPVMGLIFPPLMRIIGFNLLMLNKGLAPLNFSLIMQGFRLCGGDQRAMKTDEVCDRPLETFGSHPCYLQHEQRGVTLPSNTCPSTR